MSGTASSAPGSSGTKGWGARITAYCVATEAYWRNGHLCSSYQRISSLILAESAKPASEFQLLSIGFCGSLMVHIESEEHFVAAISGFKAVQQAQSTLEEPYTKSLLKKWDLHGKLQLHTFYYTKYYHKLQGQQLVQDLFNDPEFQQAFKVATKSGPAQLQGFISEFQVEPVPATETRLDMFDRLLTADPPIVRKTADGDIIKCMDDYRGGFQVSDELRRLLLCDEREHADLYSREERQQLLWRLFELVCLGGACCQFERSFEVSQQCLLASYALMASISCVVVCSIRLQQATGCACETSCISWATREASSQNQLQPYLEVTKLLYKALLSVQKNSSTGKVEVTSTVLEVKSCSCDSGVRLFPSQSRNNVCFVAIDPLKRIVKVLYHGFVPYW